jgi:hypothetical protein
VTGVVVGVVFLGWWRGGETNHGKISRNAKSLSFIMIIYIYAGRQHDRHFSMIAPLGVVTPSGPPPHHPTTTPGDHGLKLHDHHPESGYAE